MIIQKQLTHLSFFGIEFPTTPDSVFGNFNGVFSGSITDLWNLGQAIADQQNVDTASGIYLDYLGALVGVNRNLSTGSNGKLLFFTVDGYTIPAGTQASTFAGDTVSTNAAQVSTSSAANHVSLEVNTLQDFTAYSVTINGEIATYFSGAGVTAEEIIIGLAAAIELNITGVNAVATAFDLILSITSDAEDNDLNVSWTSNLAVESVGVLTEATADVEGVISFPSTTLVVLTAPNVNILSVTNPNAFNVGTELETDEEYRLRIKSRQQTTGTATKPSIEASLLQIDGVTAAYVEENITIFNTTLPPKSYEAFVTGGDEQNIANDLWRTKPCGISTYGSITRTVVDENGDQQAISFSRPTELFTWVRVTYSLNTEETFPADGESAMANAVVDQGERMYAGEDLVGSKFYGALYTVPGHYVTQVETSTTQLSGETPVYTTAPIPIPVSANLNFSTIRVEFIEV